jgi:hypothetical protein
VALPAPTVVRAVQAPREQRPAIEQHVHHHWHGISPEDVAEIIEQQRRDG